MNYRYRHLFWYNNQISLLEILIKVDLYFRPHHFYLFKNLNPEIQFNFYFVN